MRLLLFQNQIQSMYGTCCTRVKHKYRRTTVHAVRVSLGLFNNRKKLHVQTQMRALHDFAGGVRHARVIRKTGVAAAFYSSQKSKQKHRARVIGSF